MSWHTGFLLVRSDATTAAVLASLGISMQATGEMMSLDEAIDYSDTGLVCGVSHGWRWIIDPLMFLEFVGPDHAVLPSVVPRPLEVKILEQGVEVVACLLEGTSGTYGYAHFVNGQRTRMFLTQEGETLVDEGEPGSGEADARRNSPNDEEQFILSLAFQGARYENFEGVEFEVYR